MNCIEATVEILKSALDNNAIVLDVFTYNNDESAEKANSFNIKQIEKFITTTYTSLQKLDNSR